MKKTYIQPTVETTELIAGLIMQTGSCTPGIGIGDPIPGGGVGG